MSKELNHAYTLTLIDPTYNEELVVGIFEAEGLAEMSRKEAELKMTEQMIDRGVFFRITAYQVGKLYHGWEYNGWEG